MLPKPVMEKEPDAPFAKSREDELRARRRESKESLESAARSEMNQWWSNYKQGRWLYERESFRNILYYLGYQWLQFDLGSRQWRRQELKSWVPRPVTNRFAPTLDVIRSAIINAKPRFLVEPARTEDRVIAAARVADDFLGVIQADSNFRKAKREMASWVTMTGTCLFGTEFSLSPDHGIVTMFGEMCVNCGEEYKFSELPENDVCPNCNMNAGWLETKNEEKREDVPRGRMVTTAWSPFEIFVDQGTPELEDQPVLITARSYHIDTARRYWKNSVDKLMPETAAPLASTYLNVAAIPTVGYTNGGVQERVLIRRMMMPPCEKYPEGMFAVLTGGGRLIEVKPYPFLYKESNRPYFPTVKIVYGQVPGRFWGKTPATDLAPKQQQRNRFESLFELITMTMASPVWLIPTGSNPSKITGAPGIQITATPVSGQMPSRLQGMGPDASLVQFLDKIDQDFEEIANTFAVLKGKTPGGGVRAAGALRQLEERGYGAFGQVFENLEEGYEEWAIKALEQFRSNGDEPYVKMVMNAYGEWAAQEFRKADLAPEINITVESNSVRPKSSAAKVDSIQRLVAMGVINGQYPEQKMRILEETGMQSLLPGIDRDKERAMRENAQFLDWAKKMAQQIVQAQDPQAVLEIMQNQQPPIEINVLVDEHIQHFIHHRRFCMTDDYLALPKTFRAWFEQNHLAGHLQAYQSLMAAGGVPGNLSPVPFGMPPAAPPTKPPRPGGGG